MTATKAFQKLKGYVPLDWAELWQSIYNTKPRDSKGRFIKRS